MAKTSIEWTDFSFNPWWGCRRVSPGCEHCYAETFSKRVGLKVWGPAKTTERRLFGEKHWREPFRWNAAAEKAGERARVFCASMADVFEDHPALPAEREKLWPLIEATPWLDWQLLTKRPENVRGMVPARWLERFGGSFPPNVWLGTSVEDQQRADERIPRLLEIPAAVRFLSCEPLLGPVDLRYDWFFPPTPDPLPLDGNYREPLALHWVIVGGESGHGARPFDIRWARSLVAQCRSAGAAPFVKQLGARPIMRPLVSERASGHPGSATRFRDAKGGDWSEWPEDLRVREMAPVGPLK